MGNPSVLEYCIIISHQNESSFIIAGGFFSGLGGQPNPEAAKTNPFGTPSAGTAGSGFGTSSGE